MRQENKTNRLICLALNIAVSVLLLLIISLTTISTSILSASLNIATTPDFTYSYEDHTFRCYKRESHPGEVSIGWGMAANAETDHVNVPQTVTNGSDTYTVTGVVQGGFRYCEFQTITLPNTITEIEEEGFAYCTKMTRFVLPYGVTEIKDSAFLDCRNMVNFFYFDDEGVIVVTNDKVESIGDHAFDSCVSLVDFTASTVLKSVGTCAFQRCEALTRFYFPSKTGTGDGINYIDVGSYAFADCSSLIWVYFESNLRSVDDFAFVDCNTNMVFHYGYEGNYPGDPSFAQKWRRKRLESNTTTFYPIENDHIVILQSNQYPGLKYTIESSDRYLDCSKDGTTNKIKVIDANDGKYAVIYQWNAPVIDVPNYYKVSTGELELPGTLTFDNVDYPLKVINTETFANKTELTKVTFHSGLVQICKKAFYKCTNIAHLDFTDCDTLIEISNDIFNHFGSGTTNEVMHDLTLPNSLKYIGKYAFYAFRRLETLSFKTHPNEPGNLLVLGGYCFGRIAEYYQAPTVDVTLPNTLDDRVAKRANINFQETVSGNKNYNEDNWCAIGPYVFGAERDTNSSCVKRIIMEPASAAQKADNNYRTSLSPNAFNRAKFLTYFKANDNLCYIGNEAFKNCNSLREIFLTTAKAIATGKSVPWGTKTEDGTTFEQSIISGSDKANCPDLVIYLDGPAPGNINNLTASGKMYWNAEMKPTYATDFGYDPSKYQYSYSRTTIPTVYNCDFDFDSGSILYYKPSDGTFLDSAPSSLDDYSSGIISLVKEKNGSNYTVARYFTNNTNVTDEIDLSQISHPTKGNISSHITTIGGEAFAMEDKANKAGFYFILPDTVTKIDERAFFHHAENNNDYGHTSTGVRIVTYRSGGVIQPSDSEYSTIKTACINNAKNNNTRPNIEGYCILPNGVTYIGRNAFYNNSFGSVTLGSNITTLNHGAFYTQPNTSGKKGRSHISSITIGTNANFEVVNGGIYYKGANKMLLYQAQNITGELTIASGTKAIGMTGCAGTKYSKINLNTELKTIYGSGFSFNEHLTEVTGGENLEYIGAIAPNDEVYQATSLFDNMDYRSYYDGGNLGTIESRHSGFKDNPNLTTINLKAMTKLKKIGHLAFHKCGNLEQCAGGDTYKYYTYTNNAVTDKETLTTGVLDLSGCTQLTVLGRSCFNSSKIKYMHIPYTNGMLSVACDKTDAPWQGEDNKGKIFDSGTPAFLVGDIADRFCRIVDTTWASQHASSRISNVWYGSSDVYYHATSNSDLLTGSSVGNVHYWTEHPSVSGGYILFTSYANAKAYFDSLA